MEQLRRLICGEADKEAEFKHPALARIDPFQILKNAIEVYGGRRICVGPCHVVVERNQNAAVAFLAAFGARMIDQHPAHQPRAQTVKVLAVFKTQATLAKEFEKELVDDAGWLQHVLRTLAAEKRTGNPAQIRVHHLEEDICRRRLVFTPCV